MQKACLRCGETTRDNWESHEWGELHYKSPTTCIKQSVCLRCATTQDELRESHEWGEWGDYAISDSCKQTRICLRCLKVDERLEHDWKETGRHEEEREITYVNGPSYEARVYTGEFYSIITVDFECSRCSARKSESE